MNELIVNADGTFTLAGEWSPEALIQEIVDAATTPATIPDADTLAQHVTAEELKTHPWHLPFARADRMTQLVGKKNGTHNGGLRDVKFLEWDRAALTAWENGTAPAVVKAAKQKLRDLPPVVKAALDALDNTDAIAAYTPDELK